ncbi:MAG: chloride channel protein [Acidimicrobiales bacterium]
MSGAREVFSDGSVRLSRTILASVVVGILVGVLVAAFDYVTLELVLEEVLHQPVWVQAIAPFIGLSVAALILRYLGNRASPATSDEYVRAYHERTPDLPLRELPAKLLAGVATIGSGGSVGLEGPSIYAGATIGQNIQDLFGRFFRRDEAKILLTAGAACGVAAIFKTPATGVMFALEAPYRDDVARRALLPALLASAAGFLVFAAIIGTDPVFPRLGRTDQQVDVADLLGGAIIGLVAGMAARGYASLVRRAKHMAQELPLPHRLLGAGLILAGFIVAANAVFDDSVTSGPGFEAVTWLLEEDRSLALIAALFAFQIGATLTTIAGGGVGGLFIPLAVQGIIMGSFIGELLGEEQTSLYPTVGLAAFLGAGYRAPITAVMFVAESTGASPYVVPALVAAAMSQLVAGESSVAAYQRSERLGHLEGRFQLPIASALETDVFTVPSDATAAEFVYVHVLGRRERTVTVVDNGVYVGVCDLDHLKDIDRDAWEDITVGEVMATDLPTGRASWTFRDAVAAMDSADIEILPVTDSDGTFVGVVRAEDILKLGEILDETGS